MKMLRNQNILFDGRWSGLLQDFLICIQRQLNICHRISSGCTKDVARPCHWLEISALSFIQCFDTDHWVSEMMCAIPIISKSSLWEQNVVRKASRETYYD